MLKKRFFLAIIIIVILCGIDTKAQYNKNYFYYIGRSYLIDNKYRDAIETLNFLLRVDSKAYEGYFLRGIAKYNLGDLHGAEFDFTQAIENNPVYTMAYHYRAITRSRMGNYDDALNDFREAVELRPDLPGPYYSRGVTYLLNKQFDKAIDDFDEFLKFEPKVSEVYAYKGTCYVYLRDTTKAFESFDLAIKTNRYNPDGYNRRGLLYMMQNNYDNALMDFNKAVECDPEFIMGYFNRALLLANTDKPVDAINDFTKVISLDSTMSISYFNRALLRTQIGDYNMALDDYNQVALLNPNNVLVYYNRANLLSHLGYFEQAIEDYSRSIELYPDFANAYLARGSLKYILRDEHGANSDKEYAEMKIAEYRSKLNDSTFSIYADTSRHFNSIISFDPDFINEFDNVFASSKTDITLLPLFKFTLFNKNNEQHTRSYSHKEMNDFMSEVGLQGINLSNKDIEIDIDSVLILDNKIIENTWHGNFARGIIQYHIKQYTNSINSYTKAIEQEPSNAFLYLNRSATRSEMIDFISSIENNFQNITIDSDPVNRLKTNNTRIYNYDEAIYDLNKAIKLLPDFAYAYYNRGNLNCLSGNMPEAIEDYTKAIELYPELAEAYFNRGLVQIYLKDTKKGFLDVSKAGELGIEEAYFVMRQYGGIR